MRLGTRRSALAWAQSGGIAALLGPDVERVGIETAGDRLVDTPLTGPLVKGWFTEAIAAALRSGAVDLAVHSLKDLPVSDEPGLVIGAVPARGPVADVLLIRETAFDRDAPGVPLRAGAQVGMSSPRRQAALRTLRPDCGAAFLRGNVTTRLQRLAEGRFDAIVLAEAGLVRLGAEGRPPSGVRVVRLFPGWWVPAPGQGALAVQCRVDADAVRSRLVGIHDPVTAAAVGAERACLSALGGGCSIPFGAWQSAEGWAVGLESGGVWRVRRGPGPLVGLPEGLVDGVGAEPVPTRIWEEIDVGS